MFSKVVVVLVYVSFCIQISGGSNIRFVRAANGCGRPPLIPNAHKIGKHPIYMECDKNYQFPNKGTKIELYCDVNIWKLKGLGIAKPLKCERKKREFFFLQILKSFHMLKYLVQLSVIHRV